MCLAIPVLITSVEGATARVEIGGVERTISLMLTPEAQVGDYALVHTGFAIGVLDEEEAHETLRLLQELAALQEGKGREGREGREGGPGV